MKAFVAACMVLVLATVALTTGACGPGAAVGVAPRPQFSKQAPKVATVVQAYVKSETCNDNVEWTVAAKPGDWIDLGIDWLAKTPEIASQNWKDISYTITVDGAPVTGLADFQYGPEHVSLTCGSDTYEGSRLGYRILSPLTPGDHVVKWKATFNSTVSDGWFAYEAGNTEEYTATVKVGP